MNSISMLLNADELILGALKEDITSEDISTNSVMPSYKLGQVELIAKQEGISEKGFRVIVNCGEDGGQEVRHLHYHMLGGKKLGVKICG